MNRHQPWMIVVAVVVLVALVATAIVAWPRPDDGPDLTDVPAEALAPDLVPLTLDGKVLDNELAHDSRDDAYRSPFGAVPAGTDVTLRLRAAAGDLEDATVRVWDALSETQVLVPMRRGPRDGTTGSHGHDWWEAVLPTTNIPTVLYYRFIVRDGATTRYVEDDELLDGGAGEVLAGSQDRSWQLVTHEPGFTTPSWAQGAIVYQVFPDRFANGDPANDPSPDDEQGADGAARYRSGEVYGSPVLPRDWEDDLPEGHCRAYASPAEPCDEEPLGRDFYGGDLAGIREHLPELAELGVTLLYLNPIFAAPSNHRYDTSDFTVVDPDLGTNADLEGIVAEAEAVGIRVLLDGVFNHTSSEAPFFDRSGRFPEVGACEAADSPWANWYTLSDGPPEKCFDGQTYEDWFGFDTLAVLAENPDTFGYFLSRDGIAARWLEAGIGGWRLDVMNEISHGFLRGLRGSLKDMDPDALILGEEWGDASAWLLGTEADSVMNYRFRRAVIGLVNGETADSDGAIAGLSPSEFTATMEGVREDTPEAAWAVMHNLVDSHDTTRILWTLTPGSDNREEKEAAAARDEGTARLRQVAALQLTWPGMAGIYYGTEVGLTGHDDPDDRRPYPWGATDDDLRAWYAALGRLRAERDALRVGDLTFLHADDDAGTIAFGRRSDSDAAITVLNLSDGPAVVRVPTAGWLPAGTRLTDALRNADHSSVVDADGVVTVEVESRGSVVLVSDGPVDLRAPDPPASLEASAAAGLVRLSWERVDGAAGYEVWRSILSGGGYRLVGSVEGATTSFADRGVRNGTRVHYVVTAVDEAGNVGDRSPEAVALPEVEVADARLSSADRIEQPLSAVDPATPISATVRVDGYSALDGPTVGVRMELGFGSPSGSDPSAIDAEEWTWEPMLYDADDGDADRWVGAGRPEETGTHAVMARLSTDGGETWTLVGTNGLGDAATPRELVATVPGDTDAPSPPGELAATSVTETSIGLAWQAVDADDLHRYEILRAGGDGQLERIGVATDAAYTDDTVDGGTTYRYAVRAQDTSFNRSPTSDEIRVAAASRGVAVTFRVTVPANTPPDDTVFIAGDFQGWDPAGTPMSQVDDTTWEITLSFPEATAIQYKYVRGAWEAVEKDAGCGEIPNREMTVTHGETGTLDQADEVARWRDVDACP